MSKKLDWREIPQRYRFATKNASGTWYLHTESPEMDSDEEAWFSDDMYPAHWLKGLKRKMAWQESLIGRDVDAKFCRPTVDWSRIPANFDWISTNEDNETFAYSERPMADDSIKGDGYWSVSPDDKCFEIEPSSHNFRIGTCGWKSSLLERPNRTTRLKPSMNWAIVPEIYRWLATDMNGEIWLYQNRPEIDDGRRWVDMTGASACPVTKWQDVFAGKLPWYDSVVERPRDA